MVRLFFGLIILMLGLLGAAPAAPKVNYRQILLTKHNTVTFRGPVDVNSVQMAIIELEVLNIERKLKTDPIYLVLDTPGGDVDAARDLAKAIEDIPNAYFIMLDAYSAGAFMPQFTTDRKRLVADKAHVMVHRMTFSIFNKHADKLKDLVDLCVEEEKQLLGELAKKNEDSRGRCYENVER